MGCWKNKRSSKHPSVATKSVRRRLRRTVPPMKVWNQEHLLWEPKDSASPSPNLEKSRRKHVYRKIVANQQSTTRSLEAVIKNLTSYFLVCFSNVVYIKNEIVESQ